MKKFALLVVALLFAFALSTPLTTLAAPTNQSRTVTVEMQPGDQFAPSVVTIQPGDTVTWLNVDPEVHNVISQDGTINSGDVAANQKYSHTFATAGTYEYYCSYHANAAGTAGMVARIVVQAGASGTSSTLPTTGTADNLLWLLVGLALVAVTTGWLLRRPAPQVS